MNIEDLTSQYWESTLHGTSLASWLAQDLAVVLLWQEGGDGFSNSYPETKSAHLRINAWNFLGQRAYFQNFCC